MQLFVGNLAYTATEADVRQAFEAYGTVDRVNLITDRETGRARGFGFVDMPDDAAARAAMAGLDGKDLAGRAITVNEARPRADRQGPRGARGDGRGDGRRPRW
jgi:RNA recognition motif-containing protein